MVDAILRPDGDDTIEWTPIPAGTHHTTVDDAVEQPNAGDMDDRLHAGSINSNDIDILDMETISVSSVSQVVLWFYGAAQVSVIFKTDLYIGGWQGEANVTLGADYLNPAWGSVIYSGLSASQADLNGMQVKFIAPVMGMYDGVNIATMYAKITYTAPPTGPDGIEKVYGIESSAIAKKYGVAWSDIAKIYGIE